MVKAAAVAEKGVRLASPEGGRALALQRTGSYESEAFNTHRLSLLSRLIARETREMRIRAICGRKTAGTTIA